MPRGRVIWRPDKGELILVDTDTDDLSLAGELEAASRVCPIRHLDVAQNPRITSAGFTFIGQYDTLEHLDLGDTWFGDGDIEKCLLPLTQLNVLIVSRSKLTVKGLPLLASRRLPSQELFIAPDLLDNQWSAVLGQFTWLQKLGILEDNHCRILDRHSEEKKNPEQKGRSMAWIPTPAARKLKEALPATEVFVNYVKVG